MVSIERAIEDLRKAELVGEDIVTTEGEIIILLDALKDLRNATKRIVERLEDANMTAVDVANKRYDLYSHGVVEGIEKAIEIVEEELS